MPSGQVVVLPSAGRDDAYKSVLKAQLLQRSVGDVGSAIGNVFATYAEMKEKQRATKLAGFKMASELAGGPDMLPPEALEGFEEAIGVKLPRDETTGRIKITPNAQVLADRALADLLKKDPEGTTKILKGLQNPAPNPEALAFDEKQLAQAKELKLLEIASNEARTRMSAAASFARAAATRAAAASKEGRLDAPSGFYQDPQTGEILSDAQVMAKMQESGQSFEARPLTFRQADLAAKTFKQKMDVETGGAIIAQREARTKYLDLQTANLLRKKPELEHLLDAAKQFRMAKDMASFDTVMAKVKEEFRKDGTLPMEDVETGWDLMGTLNSIIAGSLDDPTLLGGMPSMSSSPTTTTPPSTAPGFNDLLKQYGY